MEVLRDVLVIQPEPLYTAIRTDDFFIVSVPDIIPVRGRDPSWPGQPHIRIAWTRHGIDRGCFYFCEVHGVLLLYRPVDQQPVPVAQIHPVEPIQGLRTEPVIEGMGEGVDPQTTSDFNCQVIHISDPTVWNA